LHCAYYVCSSLNIKGDDDVDDDDNDGGRDDYDDGDGDGGRDGHGEHTRNNLNNLPRDKIQKTCSLDDLFFVSFSIARCAFKIFSVDFRQYTGC